MLFKFYLNSTLQTDLNYKKLITYHRIYIVNLRKVRKFGKYIGKKPKKKYEKRKKNGHFYTIIHVKCTDIQISMYWFTFIRTWVKIVMYGCTVRFRISYIVVNFQKRSIYICTTVSPVHVKFPNSVISKKGKRHRT